MVVHDSDLSRHGQDDLCEFEAGLVHGVSFSRIARVMSWKQKTNKNNTRLGDADHLLECLPSVHEGPWF